MEITEVTNVLYVFHWFLIQTHNILQWTVDSTLPCGGVGGQNDPHSLLLWSWFSIFSPFLSFIFTKILQNTYLLCLYLAIYLAVMINLNRIKQLNLDLVLHSNWSKPTVRSIKKWMDGKV